MTLAQVAGLGVGILGLVLLGEIAGAIGAAIASGLGYAVTILILAIRLRTRPSEFVPRPYDFVDSIRRLWRS